MSEQYLQRVNALAAKYVRLKLRNCRPTSLCGRFVGPRVLMNSIPKSGTNLLEQALGHFPLLHRSGFRTLRGWKSVNSSTVKKLKNLEKGGVVTGHLPAHPELLEIIEEKKIKTLLMIRDPRDVLVSYVKYVTRIDKTHPAHSYFKNLPDDETRLLDAIRGVDGVVSPVVETLQVFSGWLDSGAMVVRFEDIIGKKGGGSDEKQFEVINKIAEHIGIKLTAAEALAICRSTYSPESITFRKPQINGWRDVFCDKHLSLFDSKIGDLMQKYGYMDS